jgi:hypothetical protein
VRKNDTKMKSDVQKVIRILAELIFFSVGQGSNFYGVLQGINVENEKRRKGQAYCMADRVNQGQLE